MVIRLHPFLVIHDSPYTWTLRCSIEYLSTATSTIAAAMVVTSSFYTSQQGENNKQSCDEKFEIHLENYLELFMVMMLIVIWVRNSIRLANTLTHLTPELKSVSLEELSTARINSLTVLNFWHFQCKVTYSAYHLRPILCSKLLIFKR